MDTRACAEEFPFCLQSYIAPGIRRGNSEIPTPVRRLPGLSPSQRRPSSVETLLSGNSGSQPPRSILSVRKLFLINCLSAIQEPLSAHKVADAYVSTIAARIEGHVAALVEIEVGVILERCGLQKKVASIKQRLQKGTQGEIVLKEEETDDGKPMAEAEGMSPGAVAESLKLLFGLLGGNEGAIPEFEQIQVPQLRSETCGRVAKVLAEAYEVVYNAVSDPSNGYSDPKGMLRHTPEQIKTILGL